MAQASVAAGILLSVGGFVLSPAVQQRVAELDAELGATPTPSAEPTAVAPDPAVVAQRQAAVVAAAAVAEQADAVRAGAAEVAVDGDKLAPLDQAVQELSALITTVEQQQPALSELRPKVDGTAAAPVGPVLPTDTTAAADAAAAAAASAAASATEEATTGAATDATAPAETETDAPVETEPSEPVDVDPSTATDDTATEAADAPVLDDETTAMLQASIDRVAALSTEVANATQEARDAAAAASAAALKEAQRTSLDAYANGRVPASALCSLDFAPGQQLRCDAAEALESLAVAYRAEFGTDLVVSDSYRSYAAQVACRAAKGSLCATPGTSNHGNGTAVDLGGSAHTFGTDAHDWLLKHAEDFGWTLPSWARISGSKPEPWHWEYIG